MNKELKDDELFLTSHVMILICYTIFSAILFAEAIVFGWERWTLFLMAFGVACAWYIQIRQNLSAYARLWVYSMLLMAAFFLYGIHRTAIFDPCAVIIAFIMLYTVTGVKAFTWFCQWTFFVTALYDFIDGVLSGAPVMRFELTKGIFHMALILVVGWIARIIIDRWSRVLGNADRQIINLKDSTEKLNDFLANVSHEIRTPANAVIGFTGLCLEKEHVEDIKRDMYCVLDAGKRIGEQITDILDYSEIDRGMLAVTRENYMITSVVNDVCTQIAPFVTETCDLVIDLDASVPTVMNTDVEKLKKILLHLMKNALKYTKEGGVYVHIYPRAEDYGVNLCIEVEDTGTGMDEGEAERALLGFYQGDSSRTRKGGGLGLGLAIVKGFVTSLGGFLTIKSQKDHGTRIRVSIPQQIIEPEKCMSVADGEKLCLGAYLRFEKFKYPQVREYYSRLMKSVVEGAGSVIHIVESIADLKRLTERVQLSHLLVGQEEYEEDPAFMENLAKRTLVVVAAAKDFTPVEHSRVLHMAKPVSGVTVVEILNMTPGVVRQEEKQMLFTNVRALVVDDEPMNLSVAKGIFGRYGMSIDTVLSGPEAIRACEEKDYDIVFMDHMMPEMDGVEAAHKIRSSARIRGQKFAIVALTANAVSTAKEMFLSEGFDGFISKPMEKGEMERVLKRVLPAEKLSYVDAGDYPDAVPAYEKADGTPEGKLSNEKADGTPEGKLSNEKADGTPDGKLAYGEADDTAEEKAQSVLFEKMQAAGVDIAAGMDYCQGDEEFYRSLLSEYASEEANKAGKLTAAFEAGNLKNYEIYVHSVKSTSKMIGAADLSRAAQALEKTASAGNSISSDAHHALLFDYRRIAQAIADDLGITGAFGADGDGTRQGAVPEVLEFEAGDMEVMEFEAEE